MPPGEAENQVQARLNWGAGERLRDGSRLLAETQVGRVEWLGQKSAVPGKQDVPLRRERARRARQDPPPFVGRVDCGHEDTGVLRLGTYER